MELKLNTKMEWYEAQADNIKICLELDEGNSMTCRNAISVMDKYEDLHVLDMELRRHAAMHLLEDGNDWLDDAGQEPIDEEAFIQRIKPESIVFHSDGSLDGYYDDGEIFWGHAIIVYVNASGKCEGAEIAG